MSDTETIAQQRERIYQAAQQAEQVKAVLFPMLDEIDREINDLLRSMPASTPIEGYVYLKARADTLDRLRNQINTTIQTAADERVVAELEQEAQDTTPGSDWLPH